MLTWLAFCLEVLLWLDPRSVFHPPLVPHFVKSCRLRRRLIWPTTWYLPNWSWLFLVNNLLHAIMCFYLCGSPCHHSFSYGSLQIHSPGWFPSVDCRLSCSLLISVAAFISYWVFYLSLVSVVEYVASSCLAAVRNLPFYSPMLLLLLTKALSRCLTRIRPWWRRL